MPIIGREVKFLSFLVLRVFKPHLPVFVTEPHVHGQLQLFRAKMRDAYLTFAFASFVMGTMGSRVVLITPSI